MFSLQKTIRSLNGDKKKSELPGASMSTTGLLSEMDHAETTGHCSIMPGEKQFTQEELIELDWTHDLLFEEYLNSRGWRSTRKSAMHENEIDTSADTSGSFHGDNPRYNLFPDSTDRLDSFDGEYDRLSDLSFRTSNTHGDEVSAFENYMLERMQRINDAGDESDEEGSESSDEDNWRDHLDSVTNEYDTSAVGFDSQYGLDIFAKRSVKPNDFLYHRTDDNNKTFSRKVLESTKVSHSENYYGIPLNAKDSLENYCRAQPVELNSSNVDRILESKDPMFAMSNQPRAKFDPSTVLEVEGLDQIQLKLESESSSPSVCFKSNLSAIYCKNGYRVLVVAVGSKIRLYDISRVTSEGPESLLSSSDPSKPEYQYLGHLALEFRNTTNDQIENSVNPHERYSINYITIKELERTHDANVLAICNDFSQVIILSMEEIVSHFFNETLSHASRSELHDWFFNNGDEMVFSCSCVKNQSSFFKSTFRPFDRPLELKASAWCVDICGEVMAISDNERRVTVFVNILSGPIQRYESPVLSHNIPYLNIVESEFTSFFISCGTYGSHQYILHLFATFNDDTKYKLRVIDAIETDGPVWTCNFVRERDFMSVNSFRELTGDVMSNLDGHKLDKIIAQSAILDADKIFTEFLPSQIGLNAFFTHLSIPSLTSRHFQKRSKSKSMAVSEIHQIERIRKLYDDWYRAYKRPDRRIGYEYQYTRARENAPGEKVFLRLYLVTTTTKSVGLFLFRELINLATCKQVFPIIDSPYIVERSDVEGESDVAGGSHNVDSHGFTSFRSTANRRDPLMPPRFDFLNRIYLSFPILSLNAIVVATQAGQVAVFRLTRFNGMHSMRLESVLIDAERYAMGQDGRIRSIIGLTGCICGHGDRGDEEWMLVVVYSDLLTLNYKIHKNNDVGEENKLNIFSVV